MELVFNGKALSFHHSPEIIITLIIQFLYCQYKQLTLQ